MHLENVRSSASLRLLFILGFPGVVIDALSFRNCEFRDVEQTEVLTRAGRIVFDSVAIIPARKPQGRNSVVALNPDPLQPKPPT